MPGAGVQRAAGAARSGKVSVLPPTDPAAQVEAFPNEYLAGDQRRLSAAGPARIEVHPELEAQVRGSRHAWDIRLISVESLLNLVRIKESADSQETVAKIRRLLTPLEYTRLDYLVDVVFTTAQDVETAISAESGEPLAPESRTVEAPTKSTWDFTPSAVIQEIRNGIVAALAQRLKCSLIKKSRVLYWDPSQATRVACTLSKRYENSGLVKYWYAYHPPWHSFLTEAKHGFFVLGCTDLNLAFSLPVAVISDHLKDFHVGETRDGERQYHHIKIVESDAGRYGLQLPRSGDALPLDPYVLRLTRISSPPGPSARTLSEAPPRRRS